ncbi:MAG TPA: SDR family oxidoreductase [Symbiobacteriaceae bacterium]|nr:SDR family oxidoreductase [Symbiobacteriaceae bacterium]
MKISGNTVLVTGGASGIGLALAERFVQAGNQVIICGRRPEKLAEAKQKLPTLQTRVCDVASEQDRLALLAWAKQEFPALNMLVNNAGIQNRTNLLEAKPENWAQYQQEIAINLEAPIHLSMLFLPHLAGQAGATIINVTSGLAFTPLAFAPIYCATKAALHSFTLSLRHQVADQQIEVIEVVPPAVQTDLGGAGLHTFGEPLDAFADAVFEGFARGDREIGYGRAATAMRLSREQIDEAFVRMNSRQGG